MNEANLDGITFGMKPDLLGHTSIIFLFFIIRFIKI